MKKLKRKKEQKERNDDIYRGMRFSYISTLEKFLYLKLLTNKIFSSTIMFNFDNAKASLKVEKFINSGLSIFQRIRKINFVFYLSVFLVLVLFKNFWEEKVIHWIVKPFLYHAMPSCVADHVWLTLIGIIIIGSIYKYVKGYVVSDNLFWVLLGITALYYYYRFLEFRFTFYPLKSYPSVHYFDLIFVTFTILTLLKFLPHWKGKLDKNSKEIAFIIDQPIQKSKDDRLARKQSAKNLAQRILATQNNKAFAIGINGEWGSGKTSYLNLIQEALPKDVITVHFNSWQSMDSASLIKDFFNTLAGKLKRHSTEFNDVAKLYSKQLSAKEQPLQQLLGSVFWVKDDSLNEYYERINQILKKLGRKIIVFIDDLDRLDNEEIYEVLKLIRNTADFNYVSYIVAYDKKYVNKSIAELLKDGNNTFLEKIFQFEHLLPFSEKSHLLDILYENLFDAFPEQKEAFNEEFFGLPVPGGGMSLRTINNIRDVKRFLNSFIYHYGKIKGEVDFVDFFNLEVLKLKYQLVYEDLYHNSGFYLEHYQNTKDSHIVFRSVGKDDSVELYLQSKKDDLNLTSNAIKEVVDLFSVIFRKNIFASDNNPLSISFVRNFPRYFTHALHKHDLSENEFKVAKELPFEQFAEKVNTWISEGKRWELIRKFQEYKYVKDFKDREEFEKLVKIVYYISQSEADANLQVGYVGYPKEDFFYKINDYDNKIVKRLYNNDTQTYKDFILSLFNNAKFPYIETASFITYILESGQEIIVPSEELKAFLPKYLDAYTQEEKQPSYNNFTVYHLLRANYKHGNKIEGFKIFIQYLQNGYLKFFLKQIIDPNPFSMMEEGIDPHYMLSSSVNEFFDSLDEFEKFLSLQKNDPEVEEFRKFYQTWKAAGRPIPFLFQVLPFNDAREK